LSAGTPHSAAEIDFSAVKKHVSSAQKLNVCHVASGDRWAGAEVQLAALLKALRLDPTLHVSAIFLNEGRLANEARRAGVEVCILDETRLDFFHILSGAAQFLKGKSVRILHSHRYKETLLAALLSCFCHVPIHVCSKHGAPEPFQGWQRYKQAAIQFLDGWVTRICVDSVISVSEELRTRLRRIVTAKKVVTIYNGIDEESVVSFLSPQDAKERLGIPPYCPVIGTAGRLDPIKRLDIFLRAAQEMLVAQPNARFIIAGEGQQESHLCSLAATLGIENQVLFLGHRDDVYDVLRAMDIFVLCSDHEGLPMTLLEALYLRVPVVVRPVGGITEVIRDGVNGICVQSSEPLELAHACLRLVDGMARRTALGNAGAARVAEQFTVEQTARQVLQLYNSLSSGLMTKAPRRNWDEV
jgi:glycosyltransferase involved in cell wall biosynthesis